MSRLLAPVAVVTLSGVSRVVSLRVPPMRTIALDPPWQERGGGRIKRGADRHYETMPTWKIIETIIRCSLWLPDREAGCLVWIWATNTRVVTGEVHRVGEALGLHPLSLRTWIKDQIGIGQYMRGQSEQALLFRAGSARVPPRQKNPVTTVLAAPSPRVRGRVVHSAKPDEFYCDAERLSPAPRAEIFARAPREGWHCWGDDPGLLSLVPGSNSGT